MRLFLVALLLMTLPGEGPAWGQAPPPSSRQASSKLPRRAGRVPPPKWDKKMLDVFFPDARAKLGPGGPPSTTASASPAKSPAASGSAPPDPAAAAQGTWSKLVTAQSLEDEVKAQLPLLRTPLASASAFKSGGFKAVRDRFSLLAVLFGVISEYEGEVRWKSDAAAMRARFAQAGRSQGDTDDTAFQQAQRLQEDLAELVRGGSVTSPPPPKRPSWSGVAERPALMRRLDAAKEERIKPWTSSAADFDAHRDELLRETEMILLLSAIIKDSGYDSAEEETYQEFVRQLQSQGQALKDAISGGDFGGAQQAAGRVEKSCNACHGEFKG